MYASRDMKKYELVNYLGFYFLFYETNIKF